MQIASPSLKGKERRVGRSAPLYDRAEEQRYGFFVPAPALAPADALT